MRCTDIILLSVRSHEVFSPPLLTDVIMVLSCFFSILLLRSFLMELGQAPVCRPFVACTFLLDQPRKAIEKFCASFFDGQFSVICRVGGALLFLKF